MDYRASSSIHLLAGRVRRIAGLNDLARRCVNDVAGCHRRRHHHRLASAARLDDDGLVVLLLLAAALGECDVIPARPGAGLACQRLAQSLELLVLKTAPILLRSMSDRMIRSKCIACLTSAGALTQITYAQ